MTPNIAIVHVNNPHGPNFRLWLPLFLLWIPALLLAPFVLVVLGGACICTGIPFWQSVRSFWAIVCGLPGTDVRVTTEGNCVLVRIL